MDAEAPPSLALHPRPELARRYLARLTSSPNRALSLFGPRQVGKTTLLQVDLAALAQEQGLEVVYVDFMATSNALALLNSRLAQLVHAARAALPKRRVKAVGAAGLNVHLEDAPADPSSADLGVQLLNEFAALKRLKPRAKVLFMLDEAQELVKHPSGEGAMKAIRALFNTHLGDVLLLITGSSREGLLRLFGDRYRASFGLADHEDFQRLGLEFVVAKAKAFNAQRRRPIGIETLNEAFVAMEQRPADFVAFLAFLAVNDIRDVLGSVPTFLQTRYPAQAIVERFERFTPLQQAVLRALAGGVVQMTSRATQDIIATSIGGTVTAGGIRHALTSLPPDVLANPARGHYEIADRALLALLREPRS
jgi:hypothetical protein